MGGCRSDLPKPNIKEALENEQQCLRESYRTKRTCKMHINLLFLNLRSSAKVTDANPRTAHSVGRTAAEAEINAGFANVPVQLALNQQVCTYGHPSHHVEVLQCGCCV